MTTEPVRDQQPKTVHAPMQQSKLQNYNSTRGATAYKADYDNKLHRKVSDKKERAILERHFATIGRCERILDLPSGHGRLSGFLKERCAHLIEGDWSFTMVALNQQDHGGDGRSYVRASALEIPLPDRAVDAVVSFRLSHHLETPELRERHLRELFRVADRAVVATWFSHTSLKAVLRRFRTRFTSKKEKNTLRNSRVAEIASACGFEVRAMPPLFRIGSGHIVGLFTRRPGA